MNNIMIDLETLGTGHNAVILSIGAVEFDNVGMGRTFHKHLDLEQCTKLGMEIDARTVLWWLDQSAEARAAVTTGVREDVFLVLAALRDAFDWTTNTVVWANGADFDFPILKNAHELCGTTLPWRYYNTRDMRTLKSLVSSGDYQSCKVDNLLAHHALNDAMAQAETTINLLNLIHRRRGLDRAA